MSRKSSIISNHLTLLVGQQAIPTTNPLYKKKKKPTQYLRGRHRSMRNNGEQMCWGDGGEGTDRGFPTCLTAKTMLQNPSEDMLSKV